MANKSLSPQAKEVQKNLLKEKDEMISFLNETLDPVTYHKFKVICHHISKSGLSEEESCILANYPKAKLYNLKQEYPLIADFLSKKQLEYKAALMRSIAAKATQGDDKLAMWLLERNFPEEFARRKIVEDPSRANSTITNAFQFIIAQNGENPLIKNKSERKKKVEVLEIKESFDALC
jgi:hypothetical protein